jgi:hypothetical protein
MWLRPHYSAWMEQRKARVRAAAQSRTCGAGRPLRGDRLDAGPLAVPGTTLPPNRRQLYPRSGARTLRKPPAPRSARCCARKRCPWRAVGVWSPGRAALAPGTAIRRASELPSTAADRDTCPATATRRACGGDDPPRPGHYGCVNKVPTVPALVIGPTAHEASTAAAARRIASKDTANRARDADAPRAWPTSCEHLGLGIPGSGQSHLRRTSKLQRFRARRRIVLATAAARARQGSRV